MLIGTHAVIYSGKPDADRKFLREVLGLRYVDAGGGYVIFSLPAAEASVHESGAANPGRHRVACDAVQDTGWGLLTTVKLPGGGELGVYQPKHHRP